MTSKMGVFGGRQVASFMLVCRVRICLDICKFQIYISPNESLCKLYFYNLVIFHNISVKFCGVCGVFSVDCVIVQHFA